MEEEERPRKLPKLDNGDGQDSGILDSTMTGALLPDNEAGHENAPKETSKVNGNGQEEVKEKETGSDPKPAVSTTEESKEAVEEPTPALSKHQLKKLRRREQWEAGREWRKAKRKEKLVAKRERKRAAREEAKNGTTPEEGAEPAKAIIDRSTKRGQQRQSILLPLTFILDCSFDDLMLEKERISLGSQLTRSYSDNSRAPYRAHMVISSFDKLLKHRFDTVLAKTHEHWKGIRFMQEDFVHAADMAKEWMKEPGHKMVGVFTDKSDAKPEDGEVIYLSSDSPYTLTELKPYSTYIIGGLVDKNRYKGICYKRATEKGIKTAKLPIGDYIQMSARSVLATNHVVEIMLRWLELGDWGQAFMQVIPSRKGGVLKEGGTSSSVGDGEEHEAETGEDGDEVENTEKAIDRTEVAADDTGSADAQQES